MAKRKLILKIDFDIMAQAKQYAKEHNISVYKIAEAYIQHLAELERGKNLTKSA